VDSYTLFDQSLFPAIFASLQIFFLSSDILVSVPTREIRQVESSFASVRLSQST
jgi:hypothetical protein